MVEIASLTPRGRLSSVANALSILKCFTPEKTVWRVTDLAKTLDMSTSAVSRNIQTLVDYQFLTKDDHSAAYRLGPALLTLAGTYLADLDIYREVSPIVNKVATETGENAQLAVIQDMQLFYLERVPSPYYSDIYTGMGVYSSLSATSSGKVLTAFHEDPAFVDQVIDQGLEAYTTETNTNPLKFRQEIESVREQGYATSREQVTKGNLSISVPIWDYQNKAVAAMSVAGPISRIGPEKEEKFLNILLEEAEEASERLGYGFSDF